MTHTYLQYYCTYTLICRQCNINYWTVLNLIVWQVMITLLGVVSREKLVRKLGANLCG